jgi:hypothetical protein
MKEISTELLDEVRERQGGTWTHNPAFDKQGAVIVKGAIDPAPFIQELPKHGYTRYNNGTIYDQSPKASQVSGSRETYCRPAYEALHKCDIRLIVEKTIGRKVYPTYHFDRFYLSNQTLAPHADRQACEISVSLLIDTTLTEPWPLYVLSPDMEASENNLDAGDILIYKGFECLHWRDNIPRGNNCHHQAFFHYVLQDGNYAHFAFETLL